jgi:hypothetical protein
MEKPLCRNCRHYFITYDPQLPYGCRRYGIKSKDAPSKAVESAGAGECQGFESKPTGSVGNASPKSK